MTKAKAAEGVKLYKCPNCGKQLAMNEKCTCSDPVEFIMMIGCKEQHLAYIDKAGNIWRVSNER